MSYHGDIRVGKTIYFHFTTRQFSTGAPITSASLAISVYKNDSTTESTSGVTTTFSGGFDGRAGLVSVKLDTSSDGTFYAAGNDFSLVVTGGTADSVSIVGEAVKSFSIENRSPLMPTTDGRKLDVSAGGEAGVDWANVGSPTTTVGLSGTTIATSQVVASVTGAVGSVTGAVGSVTGAVGSVTGNVGGNVTGSVGSVVGAVGSVTGNVGGNVTGSVGSVVGLTASNLDATVSSRLASASITISGGIVSADAKKMNGIPINGTGTALDLWRG